jgi:hypothetical protein
VLIGPFNASDPSNHWTSPQLDAAVAAMWADDEVQQAAAELLQLYRSSKQALIHNDLHAGGTLLGLLAAYMFCVMKLLVMLTMFTVQQAQLTFQISNTLQLLLC